MERHHAYKASDGTLHADSRKWIEHEFFLLLCTCSMNASKDEAAEMVDRFKDFQAVYSEFETDVKYGEGGRKGLVLDRRTLVKDQGPKVDTTIIPPEATKDIEHGEVDPEWRNKSRDHPVPLDKPTPLYGDVDDNGPHF